MAAYRSSIVLFHIVLLSVVCLYECTHVLQSKKTSTSIDKEAEYHITFDEQAIKCNVSKKFLSVAFSVGDLNRTQSVFDFKSRKIRRLLRALSPAVIRIGGSKANFLVFEGPPQEDDKNVPEEEKADEKSVTTDNVATQPSNTQHLESRAYVPVPSAEDIRNFEIHAQHKRSVFDNLAAFNLHRRGNKKDITKPLKQKSRFVQHHKRVAAPKADEPGDIKPDEPVERPPPVGGSESKEDQLQPPPDKDEAEKPQSPNDAEDTTPVDGPPAAPPGESEMPLPPGLKKMKDGLKKKKSRKQKKAEKIAGFRDFKMTVEQFDNLYRLINRTGNTMLFDINAFPRVNGAKSWNSSNAMELITYAQKMGYKNIDWQLGNEPNHYKKFGKDKELSGADVAHDYLQFYDLVKLRFPNANVVGPDTTRPKGKKNGSVKKWLSEFLKVVGDSLDVLSWHQYYVDGKIATEEDFVNPTNLDNFVQQNKIMKEIMEENEFKKPVWITETGSAWGGGAKGLSDRFAGVFPYVDKLGVAGDNCIDVVARQSFLSGGYAMIDKTTYNPHPEFYAGTLFKRLADIEVLNVSVDKEDAKFRVYARCAKETKHTLPGSVVAIVLNLDKIPKSFAFYGYELFKVKQYLLNSDALNSDTVKLNGAPLIMADDILPRMRPVYVEQPISIPARSVGYYVLDSVNFMIC